MMNVGKGKKKLNNVYFMDLQEAANVFENFTTKYRRTTPREEQSIFKVRSPSRKLFLAMANTIYVKQRVQKGSFATT